MKPTKQPELEKEEIIHMEHRLCVLKSFLDVESDPAFRIDGHTKNGRIFRGCKDGAMVTCRALWARFEFILHSENYQSPEDDTEPKKSDFMQTVQDKYRFASKDDPENLWKVLVAANQCVAHLDTVTKNSHGKVIPLQDHHLDPCLVNAIKFIQQLVFVKMEKFPDEVSRFKHDGLL